MFLRTPVGIQALNSSPCSGDNGNTTSSSTSEAAGSRCRFLAAERKQEKKENWNSIGRASRGRRWPCQSKHECEGGGGSRLQQQLRNIGGGGKRLAAAEEVRGGEDGG
ncbi:unnamed protein product [Lactuca saligna]|uniref:Uncharacterized protein n=1 Tax=Lactuca saligna TaxID=75948 RepID=A0AA36EL64_LACSI|nr:unnamed protein product [Lactuca saligna]